MMVDILMANRLFALQGKFYFVRECSTRLGKCVEIRFYEEYPIMHKKKPTTANTLHNILK